MGNVHNIFMEHDFYFKKFVIFTNNILLAIATNIPLLLMTSFVVQGHILYNNTLIQNILNGYIIISLYPYTKIDHESTFLDGRNKKDNFLKPIRGHFNISNVTRFTFKKQHFFFLFSVLLQKMSPVPKHPLVSDFITCRNMVVQKLKKI